MKALLTIIFLMVTLAIRGQATRPWEETLANFMTAEDVESAEWEDTYQMLCELEQ